MSESANGHLCADDHPIPVPIIVPPWRSLRLTVSSAAAQNLASFVAESGAQWSWCGPLRKPTARIPSAPTADFLPPLPACLAFCLLCAPNSQAGSRFVGGGAHVLGASVRQPAVPPGGLLQLGSERGHLSS